MYCKGYHLQANMTLFDQGMHGGNVDVRISVHLQSILL